MLFGIVLFALFTLICAVSPTFIGLVNARAFQGIGAAFTIPSAQAHIALHFIDPSKKAKALSIWGAAGIVIPAAYIILPRVFSPRAATPPHIDGRGAEDSAPVPHERLVRSVRERLKRFDALGISLGIPGVLLLTYSLTSANTEGWGDSKIITTLVISVCLLVLFVMHEHSASQAILAPHLSRNRSFTVTLSLAINTYAVQQARTYFLTVQLQSYGASAIHTSVLFIPFGISALMFNTLSGRLLSLLGARTMFIVGWALSIPGILLFSFVTKQTSYWRYTFPGMILYIAGIGAVYITANFVVVSSVSRSDQGAAAGVFNVALQVGGSLLGLVVLTAVAEGIVQKHGDGNLPQSDLSGVGYRSIYYSCAVLADIGQFPSVFAIDVPDSIRGSISKRHVISENPATAVSSQQLQGIQSRPNGS